MRTTLYYVHDPMCSWCWAFGRTLDKLGAGLPPGVELVKLLGGLAPDTDEPMPEEMREQIQGSWRRIEQHVPGMQFNFGFWERGTPRRATYPACRAVIAARRQGDEWGERMNGAIQQAYYRQARNPSDRDTLVQLGRELGLSMPAFTAALDSPEVAAELEAEVARSRALGVDSYPSLVLVRGDSRWPVPVDYNDPQPMIDTINALLS